MPQSGRILVRAKQLVAEDPDRLVQSGHSCCGRLPVACGEDPCWYSTRVPYSGTLKVCQSNAPARSRPSACTAEVATERKARLPNTAQIGRMMGQPDLRCRANQFALLLFLARIMG